MTLDDDHRDDAPTPPPPGGRIGAWLETTRHYGWLRFLIEATLVALLLRIPVVFLGVPVVGEDTRTAYDWLAEYTPLQLFVLAIVVGPILETAFAQWLPIALGRRFFQRDSYAVLLSAWIFGWLHYSQGALLVLIMFTTGLVLAWTFLVWLKRSVLAAFFMTFGVHALLNAVALSAALLMPAVEPGEEEAPATSLRVAPQLFPEIFAGRNDGADQAAERAAEGEAGGAGEVHVVAIVLAQAAGER